MQFLLFVLDFLDDGLKFVLFDEEVFDFLLLLDDVLLELLDLLLLVLDFLVLFVVLSVLLDKFGFLRVDFFLQLGDLVSDPLVPVVVLFLLL